MANNSESNPHNIILKSTPEENGICRMVLRKNFKGELVTHIENLQIGGFSSGHYFEVEQWEEALSDFMVRCKKYKVVLEV